MNSLALRVRNLRYSYPLRSDFVLHVPDWDIEAGDSVGIVGGNGSGKSTFLSLLAGVLEPNQGEIYAASKVTPLLGVGVSVNEYQTGYENICTELQNHLGRPPKESEISISASFTELSDTVLNERLHTYSSGMKARIAFAPLCAIQPGILVMDEVLAVGDNKFVPKALALAQSLIAAGNALVLASHSSETIRSYCSKAIWMENGSIFLAGDANDVMDAYDEWCREQALQMLIEEQGDLQTIPGRQPVQIREDIIDSKLSNLIIELDPSAFVTNPLRADLKITTHEGYVLFVDHCIFDDGSPKSFLVELRQMGAIDLLIEVVCYSANHRHLSLTLHPRPHGISHAGGQPIFVPFLHVI
jgi:ABC-type polysaccharide/polyol phosphate transport system ATPase subunit